MTNDDPVANDDARSVVEDSGATAFDVLANDTDADADVIEITGVSDPAHGTATVLAGSPARVSYSPDANYCNSSTGSVADSFTYTVGGGDAATVMVTVACVADDPVANDDARSVIEDSGATAFDVLANDTDADADVIEITGVSDPAHGTATVLAGSPARVSYGPDANYCNSLGSAAGDNFTYTVNGGDSATVTVTVTCVADDPPPPPPPPPVLPTCLGKTATIVATAGQRFIKGTSGPDVIVGRDAGETIDGRAGNDTICMHRGNDVVRGGGGDDVIRGGGGDDRLFGDGGNDRVSGDGGDDLLLGGAGNDDLRGGSGDDRSGGGNGDDRIDGGSGDDLLDELKLGGNGGDQLFGGSGRDRVRTSSRSADSVDCGPGLDRALIGPRDRHKHCEIVRRLRPPGGRS